ncbi:niemann-Pick type C-related protein 1 [Oleoguttula sp. CCFEE 5521]
MRSRGWLLGAILGAASTVSGLETGPPTKIHEAGRCALRGHCGKQGFFGSELPCPDNGLAEKPDPALRDKIVGICGDDWKETDVCCTSEQVDALSSNLQKASNIISACPACKKNFYDLFCTFSCSPDQSLFINVTKIEPKNDKFLVTELDQLISKEYGTGFFDSCKDVKFGATGGKAMDLIGGGAKNYTQMLKFLGDKKPFLGSPFQINFPVPNDTFTGMRPILGDPKPCNSTDERYKCACVDCPGSCPTLPELHVEEECHVGLLPCLSFGVIMVYSAIVTLIVLALTGHAAAAKRRKSKNERLQLLQDASPSDDEDEGDLIHHAGLTDRPTRQYWLNTYCDRAFSSLARVCANYPAITIVSSVIVVGLLSLGWLRFQIEKDPVKLWVAPNSDAAQEKQFFDESFGPFFRAEQAFLVNDTDVNNPGPVLTYETLQWWYNVEHRVRTRKSYDHGYTFQDVCYKPTGDACVVQSITGYFQNAGDDFSAIDEKTWKKDLQHCTEQPVDCRPDFGQPIPVERVLGGYNRTTQQAADAQALVVTWVVKGRNPGDPGLAKAEEWEQSLKDLLLDVQVEASERGLRLSFNAEISLEEELNKNTNTDVKIIVISYIVMFFYASLALGSTTVSLSSILKNPAGALVQSKFMLGIVGIIIVLMSVSASVGLFAAFGLKATLIIAEVIPFLVLAVGVDNIFLIVHEFERVNISHADESVPERVARTMGRIGPSILLSATTETVTFALGAFVGMPAVRNFAAYAAGAVLINALLQITMFVSVLALNQERVEAGRADCIPCITLQGAHDSSMPNGYGGAPFSGQEEEGWLSRFIRKTYAPTILSNRARVVILTIFLAIFGAGIALLPEIELGLDQRMAMPQGSYMIDYFNDLYAYFDAGPPVYFVTRDLNVTQRPHQRELCARFSTCNTLSLTNILEQERKRSDLSYIADSTASWIDDFLKYLDPELDTCCLDSHGEPCLADQDPPWSVTMTGMPEGEAFISQLSHWLNDTAVEDCPLAGAAAYSDAVRYNATSLTLPATHFRTAHTPLRSQHDFIAAYASARRIANDISRENNIEVFPYSKFYIFFDQYHSIIGLATTLVGSALLFILGLTTLLLGSLATAFLVTLTVAMIVTDIVATMTLVGVSLNAVSLVNIIISVGISVEFCAHIARAFTVPQPAILERAPMRGNTAGNKEGRAWAALVNVGGSVFSGITVTKLLGVFVLAFTRSKIFEVYYFRVWLALVVWAALHALVFLPVVLSLLGGRGYADPESEGGLEQDLASRRYRALLPEEDYDSDY